MKHYGDITKLNGAELPIPDIITGGSPCQDLSVAGKRAGLAGERSGLFMEQIRVIKELREHDRRTRGPGDMGRCRYMVWENVPGAFSSNGGEDFRAVLEETARVADKNAVIPEPPGGKWTPAGLIVGNGWSVAWRVHDAQYWGVPQRRKRLCVLADFDGDSAGRILFELRRKADACCQHETISSVGNVAGAEVQSVTESLFRHSAEGGETGEDATCDASQCIGETSVNILNPSDSQGNQVADANGIYPTLRGCGGAGYQQGYCLAQLPIPATFRKTAHPMNPDQAQGREESSINDTLNAYDNSESRTPTVVVTESLTTPKSLTGETISFDPSFSKNYCGSYFMDVAKTLQPGTAPGFHDAVAYGFEPGAARRLNTEERFTEECSPTLRAHMGDNQASVVYDASRRHNCEPFGDVCETVQANYGTGGNNTPIVLEGNGSRDSHHGDGYSESETMYTLNTVEHHGVCYPAKTFRKTGHPRSSEEGQGWEESSASDTLNAYDNSESRTPTEPTCIEMTSTKNTICEEGISPTLTARMGTGGNQVNAVCVGADVFNGEITGETAVTITSAVGGVNTSGAKVLCGFDAFNQASTGDVAMSITSHASDPHHIPTVCVNQGKEQDVYCIGNGQPDQLSLSEKVGALNCMHDQQSVLVNDTAHSMEVFHCTSAEDQVHTLRARDYKDPQIVARETIKNVVRRLTPKECERLQGFPDGWTDIGDWKDSKGKMHKGEADSPRYRALGNSIALPFWQWLAERIVEGIPDDPTMASLFDGIGGFPLVFSRCGCKPLWASEIEEFPIAVTKIHFPEEEEQDND